MANILFIEDEADAMQGMVNSLKSVHNLTVKTTGSDALAALRQNHAQYDLVLLDLMLPRGKPKESADKIPQMPPEEVGEFIFEKIGQFCPNMPTIVLTAVRSNMNGMPSGPTNAELMTKPVIMAELLQRINGMLEGSDSGDKIGETE